MYGANTASRIIPHLSESASAALSVMLEVSDSEVCLPVRPTLPEDAGRRFKRSPVHRAIVAASASVTLAEQVIFAADSRVTVNRALARNPRLLPEAAAVLATKALKLPDQEILDGIIPSLRVKDLFAARGEMDAATVTRAFRSREGVFAHHVAVRGDLDEITALLADDAPAFAGAMLAAVASSDSSPISFDDALALVKDEHVTLCVALLFASRVTAPFAAALARHDAFDTDSQSRRRPGNLALEASVPAILMTQATEKTAAASIAAAKVHQSDVAYVVSSVLPRVIPKSTSSDSRRARGLIAMFCRLNAEKFAQSDIDAVWTLMCSVDTQGSMSSESEEVIRTLLPLSETPQRVRLLARSSLQTFADWVSPRASGVVSCAPRPGEITAVIALRGDEWAKSASTVIGHRVLPDPIPAWFEELADALGGYFFSTTSDAFIAYTTRRLEKAIGDDEQAWRLVVATIDNFHGSLSDFCLLAQLSMTAPPDAEPEPVSIQLSLL